MTSFNLDCPAPKSCTSIEKSANRCRRERQKKRKSKIACEAFTEQVLLLLPEYDCQRPADGKAVPKYIVPAIWMCGDKKAESYMKLMSKLKGEKAEAVLGSEAFRNAVPTSMAQKDSKLRRLKSADTLTVYRIVASEPPAPANLSSKTSKKKKKTKKQSDENG